MILNFAGIEIDDSLYAPLISGKTIRIFLSYSSKDANVLAGSIKTNLENFGLEVFVAHDDIEPSTEWQEEIIRNLNSCDIFMPILSTGYPHSEWTDQESGMALALHKCIVPLKIDIMPYGFVAIYQALKFDKNNIDESCNQILSAIINRKEFGEDVKNCLIKSFANSFGFVDANNKSRIIESLENLNANQINEIVRASLINSQIHDGWASAPMVRRFFKKNIAQIKPDLRKIFEKMYA